MGMTLNPYLQFDGNAAEAMAFYSDVLGGELETNTYGEFPGAPEDYADKVMHAQLETDAGFTLMAADVPPGTSLDRGNGSTVSLSGDDADSLRGYWSALSDGAEIQVPMEKQMWGDEFGQLVDRYGISWLVNIVAPPA